MSSVYARGARRRVEEPGTLGVVRLGQLRQRAEGALGDIGRPWRAAVLGHHSLGFGLVTAVSLAARSGLAVIGGDSASN